MACLYISTDYVICDVEEFLQADCTKIQIQIAPSHKPAIFAQAAGSLVIDGTRSVYNLFEQPLRTKMADCH